MFSGDIFLFKSSQELENKEKEDEMQSSSKPVKIKGKVKARKVVEQMNKPSPMGRRVVPRIDTAMKNKADAAANKLLKAKVHCKKLMERPAWILLKALH